MNTIVIKREDLVKALGAACKVAGKSKVNQMLDNVRVSVKDGTAAFEASSIELTVRARAKAEADGNADFLIDGQALLKYAASLRDEQLELELRSSELRVRHFAGYIALPAVSPELWPKSQFDETGDAEQAEIDGAFIAEAAARGLAFVDDQDFYPMFKCVRFKVENGMASYSATNQRKLIHKTYAIDGTKDCELVIEQKTAELLKAYADGPCVVENREKSIIFHFADVSIAQQRLTYKFPDFGRVIPKESAIKATFSPNEFSSSLRRMASSVDKSTVMKAKFGNSICVLSAIDILSGKTVEEGVKCDCNEEITIGFNADMALDCLSAVGGASATFEMNEASRPILVKSPSDSDLNVVLMPMTLV